MQARYNKIKNMIIGVVVILVIGWAINIRQGKKVITATTPPEGWLEFTDPIADYTLYYPADSAPSSIAEPPQNYIRMNLLIYHPEGANYLTFYTLNNPYNLPLEAFIQTEDALKFREATDLWRTASLAPFTQPLEIGGKEALLVEQGEETFPLVGLCQQAVYIAHKEGVIEAKLCTAGKGVWELGYKAKPAGETLFWDIVSTMTFGD